MQGDRPLLFLHWTWRAIGVWATFIFVDLSVAQTVTETSELTFGTASQGSPAKVVSSGTRENSENASFRVDGPPNQSFTVVLPAGSVVISAPVGGVNTIEISEFRAFPFPNSALSRDGRRTIFVGATRAALATNQATGSYAGSYTIEILF
jgi:hypothetical protein